MVVGKCVAQERYERWWLGKKCRQKFSTGAFRKVTKVILYGPLSFVYGTVELVYEDGRAENVNMGDAFKPRKSDVEIQE